MKKVFVSILPNDSSLVKFQSRDIPLGEQSFSNPVSYLVSNSVASGDIVIVVTGLYGDKSAPQYESLKKEVGEICVKRDVSAEFVPIYIDDDREVQDSLTYSEFFKGISDAIPDNSIVYADITSDVSPLSLAVLIALNYVSKAGSVRVSDVICHNGVDIIDISSLIHILSIVSSVTAKDKPAVDNFLRFLIGA